MKKTIVLVLALILCLSLCACGGGNDIPETTVPQLDIENAITETPTHIYDDVMANQARAMQNTYILKCIIDAITNEYFECDSLRIHLPLEDLAKLNKGEEVAVVGKIAEVVKEGDSWGYTSWVIFEEAQLYDGVVPDVEPREHEIFTGLLKGKSEHYEGAWNIQIGNSNILKLIYFAEGTDLSAFNESYNSGEEITFSVDWSSRFTVEPNDFYNAKLIN